MKAIPVFMLVLITAVSVHADLCSPCVDDSDCSSIAGVCTTLDGGDYCTQSCQTSACPGGYECLNLDADGLQCLPHSLSCSCLPGDEGSTRSCEIAIFGCSTMGIQVCDPLVGWLPCVPPGEVCDGIDNDCDGDIDEGFDPVCTVAGVPAASEWGLVVMGLSVLVAGTLAVTERRYAAE